MNLEPRRGNHERRPGKLIITAYGRGKYHKYRTRQQIIPANPVKGTRRRIILHYDEVIRKTGKPTTLKNKKR